MTPPPCPRMIGSTNFVIKYVPFTFTSNVRTHSSSLVSSSVPCVTMPALLKRISMRPISRDRFIDRSAAILRPRDIGGDKDRLTARLFDLRDYGLAQLARRPVIATRAPSRANNFAVASPIPDVPPVIKATFPRNRSAM